MKFQLIAATAALLAASVAALPAAPQNDIRSLDVVDNGSFADILETRAPQDDLDDDDDFFSLTPDADFALEHLFAELEEIPDEVLEAGDEALNLWLIEHGYRSNDTAKRDVDAPANVFDAGGDGETGLVERGELEARKSTLGCIYAIGKLLVTTAVPAARILRIKKYIKALGGTKKAVKLLLKATSKKERLRIGGQALVDLAKELLGISAVKKACF
ncbi:hypothetical protein VTJ49DRAFT_6664 [Mycothermus thermophilus]|uniref:Uncharacterized protein n=1 Tax=Humicola insolens TaxID=85995 RepID=A0ABR3VK49_HUMIN